MRLIREETSTKDKRMTTVHGQTNLVYFLLRLVRKKQNKQKKTLDGCSLQSFFTFFQFFPFEHKLF